MIENLYNLDPVLGPPLRVGIAGYGIVGRKRARYIDDNPAFQIVGICDRVFPKDLERLPGVKYFSNFLELLNCSLDVVFVCLSNDMAAKATTAFLENGIHVFCEKPPARNLSELLPVLATEKKAKGVKLKYGFNHRYHQSVRESLDIISSGQMGKVINIRGVYGKSNLITFDQTDWRTKYEIAGGGILLDQGIHMVDLLRLFGGDYSKVYSFISNEYWKYDVEDNAYALMKSTDGVVAMLHSSATQWQHKFRLEVGLERGILTLSGILSGSQSYGKETLTILNADSQQQLNYDSEIQRIYEKDNSWREEISDFANDILLNREIATGNSSDALKTMQLITKIYKNGVE